MQVDPVYRWGIGEHDGPELKSFNQDMVKASFPFWMYKRWVWQSGASWGWNDLQFSGHPLWPESIFSLASVTTLLTLFFPPYTAFTLSQFVSGVLLILFGNLFLSELRLTNLARTVSVTILALSGESLAHQQYQYWECMIWLIAGLWVLTRAWRINNKRAIIGMGILGGLLWGWGLYASHLLYQAFCFAVMGVFCFWLSVTELDGGYSCPKLRVWGTYLIMVLVALGIGAWQWLPSLELVENSFRTVASKSSFMPTFVRFMPYALPQDQDLRAALISWFGFDSFEIALRSIIPLQKILVLGWRLDGHYLSPTAFFLAFCSLLYQPIRSQSRALWMSFISIVGGYNLLAIFAKLKVIRETLLRVPLLKSVNLNNIVVFSTCFIWLLTGFGMIALYELIRQRVGKRLIRGWGLTLVGYTGMALWITDRFRWMIENDFQRFLDQTAHEYPIGIIAAVQDQTMRLIERWTPMPLITTVCIILLFAEFGLLVLLRRSSLRYPVVILLSCSLAFGGFVSQSERLTWTPQKVLVPELPSIDFVRSQELPGRIYVTRQPEPIRVQLEQKLSGSQRPVDLSLGNYLHLEERPFMPAMSLLYNVEDARGLSSSNLRDYRIFLSCVSELPENQIASVPVFMTELVGDDPVYKRSWDLLNVRWVLSPDAIDNSFYIFKEDDGYFKVYENTHATPRVWFTDKARVIPNRKELIQTMTRTDWEINEILLEVEPKDVGPKDNTRYGLVPQEFVRNEHGNFDWEEQRSLFAKLWQPLITVSGHDMIWEPSTGASADIQWLEYEPGRRVVDVVVDGRGWLVWSDIFYPGWRASVDGEHWDIYRVDYTLMAMPLEPGHHKVELYYRSGSMVAGKWITKFTLGIVCLYGLSLIYRNDLKRILFSPRKEMKISSFIQINGLDDYA